VPNVVLALDAFLKELPAPGPPKELKAPCDASREEYKVKDEHCDQEQEQ
jgi:hypothetical protein